MKNQEKRSVLECMFDANKMRKIKKSSRTSLRPTVLHAVDMASIAPHCHSSGENCHSLRHPVTSSLVGWNHPLGGDLLSSCPELETTLTSDIQITES